MLAKSREDARQKVLQDCGLIMRGNIHSTLPDEEVNWAFDIHPENEDVVNNCSRGIRGAKPPMKDISLLLTVS